LIVGKPCAAEAKPQRVGTPMAFDVEKEVRELKRRLDLAETRLAQLEGQFGFVSGQLRDIQNYMHAKFAEVEDRFDQLDDDMVEVKAALANHDQRFDTLERKVDALPRALAEELDERDKRRSEPDAE